MIVLRFLVAAVLVCPTGQPATETQEPLDVRLVRITERLEPMTAFEASFEQSLHSAMLRRPMVTTGRVRVSGDVVRWDAAKPHVCVTTIDSGLVRVYDPEAGVVEEYELSGAVARVAGSPVPDFEALRRSFVIAEASDDTVPEKYRSDRYVWVRMTPRDEQLAEHVTSVVMALDERVPCAAWVRVDHPDGDRTEWVFDKATIRTGDAPEDLSLQTPPGVPIVRVGGTGGEP